MRAIGIILAGGNNNRMRELSNKRAIAAMPIAGSYRSIDFALSNMASSHIQRVAVLTQYNARSLNEHLSSSKWWDFGRKQGGMYVFTPTITAEHSDWYRGTADALYQNLDFLKRSHEPYVVLASGDGKIGNGLDEQLKNFVQEHPDTNLIIIDTMQKIREVGGEAYSYASDYEIIGRIKQFADQHGICVLTVHHTRKQQADDSFETISGTTGLLGCADGSLLMQKKKRTGLDATVKVVGRDQQDQILYLKKDPQTQIWNLERLENELHKEPPNPVLETVAKMVTEVWCGSPTELVSFLKIDMQPNTLTKHLNVNSGRLLLEHNIQYENTRTHAGRKITLTPVSEKA